MWIVFKTTFAFRSSSWENLVWRVKSVTFMTYGLDFVVGRMREFANWSVIQLSMSSSRGLEGVKSLSAFLFMKNTSPNERMVMINPAPSVRPWKKKQNKNKRNWENSSFCNEYHYKFYYESDCWHENWKQGFPPNEWDSPSATQNTTAPLTLYSLIWKCIFSKLFSLPFLEELVRRISLNIKTSCPWWSSPLFPSFECLNK